MNIDKQAPNWHQFALDNFPDGIILVQNGLIEYFNAVLLEFLYIQGEELYGKNYIEIIHPDDRSEVNELIDSIFLGSPAHSVEVRLIGKNGQSITTEFFPRIIQEGGGMPAWMGFFRDLTFETRIRDVLGLPDDKNRTLIENAPEAIVVYDVQLHRFIDANEKAVWLFGMERNTIFQLGFMELSHVSDSQGDEYQELLPQYIDRAVEGEIVEFEWDCRTAGGRSIPCEVRLALLPIPGRKLVRCSLVDITDRKQAENELIHDALYDTLTGLANRSLFYDRLDASIRRALSDAEYSFAVIFFDLDRFKRINDSLGHKAGDQMLIAVARRVSEVIGKEDLAARIAGDEFAILADDFYDLSYPTVLANDVLAALKYPFKLFGQELTMSASIGIAMGAVGYNKPENIMHDADTAMYYAKSKGKERIELFDPEIHPRAVDLLRIENELRRALLLDEFTIFFEPIVSLKTGRISGLEAFIRWQHPDRGLLMPVDFIKYAEEVGLITLIDAWVLKTACLLFKDWNNIISPPGRLAVNLSAHHIFRQNTIDLVLDALKAADLPASSLELELLESILVDDAEYIIHTMVAMKQLGLRLSLDDFGAVYSSLSQLRHLPVDNLRIDRTLIRDIVHDEASQAIVTSIISLAKRLGIQVIAEGVEYQAQLDLLAEWGCDEAQGFIFGPSRSADQVAEMLRSDKNTDS